MPKNPLMDDALAKIQDQIMKAAETIATDTQDPPARSIFSPENLDDKIKLLVPTATPMRNRLPRVRGYGQAASWLKMTSKLNTNVADGGTSTSIFFADAAAPGETSQDYERVNANFALLGRKLEVGGLAIAASRLGPTNAGFPEGTAGGGGNLPGARERIKMIEVMLGEEEAIIHGDAAIDTNSFNGLLDQITTNSGSATFLTASGIGVYAGTLHDAGFVPTSILLHRRQNQALADSLESTGTIARTFITQGDMNSVTGGTYLNKIVNPVNGTLLDVLTSRYVGNNAFILTERSEAGENYLEMEDLIPMSRIDVPSSNFSQISFIVESTVLKVIGEPAQYTIQGLATS